MKAEIRKQSKIALVAMITVIVLFIIVQIPDYIKWIQGAECFTGWYPTLRCDARAGIISTPYLAAGFSIFLLVITGFLIWAYKRVDRLPESTSASMKNNGKS